MKILVVGSYLHGSKEKDKYVEYIKKLANELENKVIFTGFISQKEVNRIYNAADVAVLPSMWDEPAGLTMVEAMASEFQWLQQIQEEYQNIQVDIV